MIDNTASTALQVTNVIMNKLGIAATSIWDAASKMAPTAMEGAKYAFLNMCKYKMAYAIGALVTLAFFWVLGIIFAFYFGPKVKASRSDEFRAMMGCLIGFYFAILAITTAIAVPGQIANALAPEGAVITEMVEATLTPARR